MEVRIGNAQEVGKKFFNYTSGRFYIYNNVFNPEHVNIKRTVVIKDYTRNNKNSLSRATNGIIGAMLAGVIGVIATTLASQPKWDVDLDVYLCDGRILELRTQSETLIKKLCKYTSEPDYRKRK